MGKKYLILTVFLLLLAGNFSSCGEKPNDESSLNSQEEIDDESPSNPQKSKGDPILQGTKWKLEGIVDNQTGSLKKLKPLDCEVCYTLEVDTNYTLSAIGIGSRLKLDLLNLNPGKVTAELKCEPYKGELYCDVDDFEKMLIQTESYVVSSDKLKLITVGGFLYLSFVPWDGDNPSTSRIGTQWKCTGITNVETGEIKEPDSKGCDFCYMLNFTTDYRCEVHGYGSRFIKDLSNLDLTLESGDSSIASPPFDAEQWLSDIQARDEYLFFWGIAYVNDYVFTPNELKLFFVFQGKNYYLSFKLTYS